MVVPLVHKSDYIHIHNSGFMGPEIPYMVVPLVHISDYIHMHNSGFMNLQNHTWQCPTKDYELRCIYAVYAD